MFKIKVENNKILNRLESLGISDSMYKEYKYVFTDNKDLFEIGKINILFNEDNVGEIIEYIKYVVLKDDLFINLENTRGVKRVNVRNIEYFEALDNEVFAIVGKERFYVLEKLYMLEEKLIDRDFVRVSKSFLVNIIKINYVKPLLNYKLSLIMNNGDKVEVNRTYTKNFKERIKI